MRQVATISDERAAKRLADHLLTLGITTKLIDSKAGWGVWVHREEKIPQAEQEARAFLADPDHPLYNGAARAASDARRDAARREKAHTRNTIRLDGRLNVPSVARCPVTYGLIAASVAVAILTGLGGGDPRTIAPFLLSPPVMSLDRTGLDDRADPSRDPEQARFDLDLRLRSTGLRDVARGQVWRLFSPMFLHFGMMHLVFNMIMLYRFGCLIEMRRGHLALVALVLVTAAVSNLGQYFWTVQTRGPDDPILFGGMSGVVYALFGYCWMKSDYDPESDIKIPSNTLVYMMLWLVLCTTGAVGRIANAAHVAGLVAGMVVGLMPHLRQEWGRR